MATNIINPVSKSLPTCNIYQCGCSKHISKRLYSSIPKQQSIDNANLVPYTNVDTSENISLVNKEHSQSQVKEENKNFMLLCPSEPIPVNIPVPKPKFDLSPTEWENFWDEEHFMTDSTSDSSPPSPASYADSVSSQILDDLDEIPSNEEPQIRKSTSPITVPTETLKELVIPSIPDTNTTNTYHNLNNNNINGDDSIKNDNDQIVSRLRYRSSTDSLYSCPSSESLRSNYNSDDTSNYVSYSSSLTHEGGRPRRRVKDSEGYIRRAACVCVDEQENKVMLTSSKKSEDVWIIPGGGLEMGEDAEEAAIREAWEEAGVKGKIARYLGVFQTQHEGSEKKHRTAVFVIVVKSIHDVFPEAHIGRLRRWFSLEDAQVQLDLHKPLQSAYLQFLIDNNTNTNTVQSI